MSYTGMGLLHGRCTLGPTSCVEDSNPLAGSIINICKPILLFYTTCSSPMLSFSAFSAAGRSDTGMSTGIISSTPLITLLL